MVRASTPPPAPQMVTVALTDAVPGQTGVVCQLCDDPRDAALLRAMGLRQNALVRVCRLGDPCIVEVLARDGCVASCGSRIGLARPLARQVMIGPAPENGPGCEAACPPGGCAADRR